MTDNKCPFCDGGGMEDDSTVCYYCNGSGGSDEWNICPECGKKQDEGKA